MSNENHQNRRSSPQRLAGGLGQRDASVLRQESPPESCRVCTEILDIIKKASEDEEFSERRVLGNAHSLMAMPCPHAESMKNLWESIELENKGPPNLWSVEIAGFENELVLFVQSPNNRLRFQREVYLLSKPGQQHHRGTSCLIDPEWVDPSIPRSWYDTCLNEHGSRCAQPLWMTRTNPEIAAYPEWLIDVEDLCIVPFESSKVTYFSLSYTWGCVDSVTNTNSTLETLRQPASLHPDTSIVPRTVRNAMNITKSMGQRYLWVDRLCIIQDDQIALSRVLNVMHQIYANSAVCLVAFAGKDANHGLRGFQGISEPRCVEQGVFNMAGGDQLCWFNKPPPTWDFLSAVHDQVRDGSTWNERGWTFQEFIFARRRLIFTDGPLRWVCSGGNMREDAPKALSVVDDLINMPPVWWMDEPSPGLETWVARVASEFNQRYFRLQEDAPRAFLGVQNFINSYFKGGLIYGHPEMFFDCSLLWHPQTTMERRVASITTASKEGILPSWSWLGWSGAFYFACDAEYEYYAPSDGFVEPVAEWFAMRSPSAPPSERRLINSRWHHYKTLSRKNAEQVPEGWKKINSISGLPLYEFGGRKFYYPVPIPSSTEAAEPTVQLPFIFARTTRARFIPRKVRSAAPKWLSRNLVEIYSTRQEFAGLLQVHSKGDVDRFLALESVELVAIAKGWSNAFSDLTVLSPGDEGGDGNKGGERPDPKDRPQSDCYFVLCIEWEHGVAKRQASGRIYTEEWEMAQEPVDLILG